MSRLNDVADWITDAMPRLLAEYRVPGAPVAVSAGDHVIEHAAGVLTVNTGVEATTDSVFEIGSVTKIWTATLIMQLVDRGELDLVRTLPRATADGRPVMIA